MTEPGAAGEQAVARVEPSAPPARAARRRAWLVPAAILALSLLPRLPNLGAPPLERHDFRQTQTAITVQAWLDRGFTLLDYETPVFGPPWKVPFEFPTFQASAFAIAKAGAPLDLACRLAALLWFYASAILLLLVARRFAGEPTATAALALYVLSPFSIQWSRACLIDYASVALALGYLLAAASWASRRDVAPGLAAVAIGALACATKITTQASVVPAVGLVLLGALRQGWPEASRAARARTLAWLAAIAALPVAAGIAWTRWADAVKGAAPATQWITSGRLHGWTFGTLEQRLTLAKWNDIYLRLDWIVPGLFRVALVLALVALWRRRGAARLAVLAALAGVVLPIVTFFNLYWVHDYYLIAATAGLALAAGAGIAELASWRLPLRRALLAVAALAAIATTEEPYQYARRAYDDTSRYPIASLARLVEHETPPEAWVVIEGDDWSPRIPYLSHRRAFMVRPPFADARLVAGRPEVRTLVCFKCPDDVLGFWPNRELAAIVGGAQVFRVFPRS